MAEPAGDTEIGSGGTPVGLGRRNIRPALQQVRRHLVEHAGPERIEVPAAFLPVRHQPRRPQHRLGLLPAQHGPRNFRGIRQVANSPFDDMNACHVQPAAQVFFEGVVYFVVS